MKVVHIESGLGNQMCDYASLLIAKKANPKAEFYVENIVFDIPEASMVYSTWNGYELGRIFGIRTPNVSELFTPVQWEQILASIRESKFWINNWQYADAICEAFRQQGILLKYKSKSARTKNIVYMRRAFAKTYCGYFLKRITQKVFEKRPTESRILFTTDNEDEYIEQDLRVMFRGSGIADVSQDIRKAFTFPCICDTYNTEMLDRIMSCESVAIHIRRSDAIGENDHLYKYGYFRRSIRYIKHQVPDCVFFIFCNKDSAEWVRHNNSVLGLDPENDRIVYVDNNRGIDSYKDMQLMAKCHHAVISNSSFGFWGAFLNEYEKKITCSPDIRYYTTHHF